MGQIFRLKKLMTAGVDPADVRKAMLTENLDLENPKTSECREFFWGGIDPYRMIIAQGRDVALNPYQTGQPPTLFATPMPRWEAKPLIFPACSKQNFSDNLTLEIRWQC